MLRAIKGQFPEHSFFIVYNLQILYMVKLEMSYPHDISTCVYLHVLYIGYFNCTYEVKTDVKISRAGSLVELFTMRKVRNFNSYFKAVG